MHLCLCRLPSWLMLAASLVASVGAQKNSAPVVTSPKAYLGQQIGADHFLADYTQLSGYWKKLASESERMVLRDIGKTSYGQRMLIAVISSPQNLRRLEDYRKISEQLCRARLDEKQAQELVAQGKAVVWIDAGMHANESVAAQNIIELVYRMVSRNDEEVRRILDNVVLLVCPANPDGMEMIARAYMANKKVGRLPVLYQRFVGHDNNRDFYNCSQVETQNINRILYHRWYPQIVYNHHQSAPEGTVIFTPPFRDPFNYNFDPMVVRGIELVSAHMNARFSWEGKPGVISRSGARYSTWWNGGLRTTTYFHNMIGILTESFGHPAPSLLRSPLKRRLPQGDHPDPVDGQMWHARQTIEYLQTANFAILDLAARYRQQFLLSIYQMGRNSIERGRRDHWTRTPRLIEEAKRRGRAFAKADGQNSASQPEGGRDAAEDSAFVDPDLRDARAYVIPAQQPDFAAGVRLVRSLLHTGIEVEQLTEAARIAGKDYGAGSFVIRCDQAFRPHVRDMFEPQWHPHDLSVNGQPVRPYDSAGWTLALQSGVRFARIVDELPQVPAAPVSLDRLAPVAGKVTAGKAGWMLQSGSSNLPIAVHELLRRGDRVERLQSSGDLFVAGGPKTVDVLRSLAAKQGLSFAGVDVRPGQDALRMRPLRIGLFDVYGGAMVTGWTEWLLRQYGFPVQLVYGDRVVQGDLRRDFDVLIFHNGLPDPGGKGRVQRALRRGRPVIVADDELKRIVGAMPPFQDWSRVGGGRVRLKREPTKKILRQFVEKGGTLITLGAQTEYLVRLLDLPIRCGVYVKKKGGGERRAKRADFFIPGSLVGLELNKAEPACADCPPRISAVFRRSKVMTITDSARVVALARYAKKDVLHSGWAIGADKLHGKVAAATMTMGRGRIYLFGVDAVYRGQPMASAKLLFGAIMHGAVSTSR